MRHAARAGLALLVAVALSSAGSAAPAAVQRARWNTTVLAHVASPGFPANVYLHPNGRVYAGTYSNPSGDHLRSVVREWTRDGKPLRSWTVPGQDLAHEHGVQVATSDHRGRLVVLDKGSGRVLRLDLSTGRFTTYSRIPDVPTCSTGRSPCSPNLVDGPPIPNYAAWGPDGSLYLTDYGQAVIWRVPPGGGAPRPWFTSRKLDGIEFSTAGLALSPDRRALLVMQQTSLGLGELTVPDGKLYRLSLATRRLTTVWESRPLDLPDGFAFARSGRVYVANSGSNQLVVLDRDFHEVERVPGLPLTGDNGSPVPFDTPSSITFAGDSVLVANQAYFGTTAHQAILDVYVGEPGAPLYIPADAGVRR